MTNYCDKLTYIHFLFLNLKQEKNISANGERKKINSKEK